MSLSPTQHGFRPSHCIANGCHTTHCGWLQTTTHLFSCYTSGKRYKQSIKQCYSTHLHNKDTWHYPPQKKKKVVSEWAVRPVSLMMVSHVYSMMNFPNEQVFNLLQFLYICPCTGHTMKVLWWGDNPKICHNTQTQIRQQQTCKIMLQLEHWLIQTVMTVSQQKITLMWLYPSRKSPLLSSSWKVKNPIYTLL